MERVIRQTILRRNQLAKKARKADLKGLRKEWREYNRTQTMHQNVMQSFIRNEQKSRREDWICGPLAPNRDAGNMKGKYGGVPNMMQMGGSIPRRYVRGPSGKGSDLKGSEDKRIFPDGEWGGQGIQGNIAIGDRVAVVNGRPGVKGMIGEISRIENNHQQVFVKEVNKVDVLPPPNAAGLRDGTTPTEIGISMADIRLVMPMQDEEQGIHRDYIVSEVRGGPPYFQRDFNSTLPRHTRYIAGLGFEIPWPLDRAERMYTRDDDTTRIDVDYQSYVPSVAYQPLEDGVIDELRSKYSRTRKTHDDIEWVKKKVLEDARKSWLEQRQSLMVRSQSGPRIPKMPGVKTSEFVRKFQEMKV